MGESLHMLELTQGDSYPRLELTRGAYISVFEITPVELQDFAHTNNFVGLATLCYFASHRRYPTYNEFEETMQALFASRVKHFPQSQEAA